MSEQSPWGSPPPYQSGTPSPPNQPPYRPAEPPSGGWGGGAPPSYGGPVGPGGKPPRKTGLIIGILAAVVVVIAAFAVTLVVTTGGDDSDDKAEDSTSETTSDDSTDDSTDDTTSDPTDDTTSDPTDDTTSDPPPDPGPRTIVGDGYTFELPGEGWTDTTDKAAELGGAGAASVDVFVVLGPSVELAQSNIIVEALSAGSASSLEDLEGLWKRNLASTDNATPVDIDEIEIDGERAIGVTIDDRVNAAGAPIKQIAYLALHEGKQYSVGLSFAAEGDVVSEPDFRKVLDSWTWTD